MASKPNLRSFRYSDRVAEIIMEFNGSTMNEKFENLVLFCFDQVPKREAALKQIEKEIENKRGESADLYRQLSDVTQLMNTLKTIQHYGEIAARGAELIANGKDHRGLPKKT